MRRISLDPETVVMLTAHRQRCEEQVRGIGVVPSDRAFLFSYQPLRDVPADPSGVRTGTGRCAPRSASTAIYTP